LLWFPLGASSAVDWRFVGGLPISFRSLYPVHSFSRWFEITAILHAAHLAFSCLGYVD
ncbi:hypothetical protein A2U01_0067616, partial [Trifolium medium]|nr:hypothetical protein [Trifolium medium]